MSTLHLSLILIACLSTGAFYAYLESIFRKQKPILRTIYCAAITFGFTFCIFSAINSFFN
jgi:hypothetical protein